MVSTAPTELEGLLKVYMALKMAAKISFQSNLEFTDFKSLWVKHLAHARSHCVCVTI